MSANPPPPPPPDPLRAELEQHRAEVELELIRRESRLIPAILGVLQHVRFRQPLADEKSRAAMTALLWKIFSPATAAAGGGLIILILTAGQVLLLMKQNEKIDQQTYVMQAQANISLSGQVAPLIDQLIIFAKTACLSPEFQRAWAEEKRAPLTSCWLDVDRERLQWIDCYKWDQAARLTDGPLKTDCFGAHAINPAASRMSYPSLPILNTELRAKLVTVTATVRPYRSLEIEDEAPAGNDEVIADDNPEIQSRSVSPERGLLLSSLLRLRLNTNGPSYLPQPDLRRAYMPALVVDQLIFPNLAEIDAPFASISQSHLSKVSDSNFRCAKLLHTRFLMVEKGDFSFASFGGSELPQMAKDFTPASLEGTDFSQAFTNSKNLLESLRGTKGFVYSDWKIVESRNSDQRARYTISAAGDDSKYENRIAQVCPKWKYAAQR